MLSTDKIINICRPLTFHFEIVRSISHYPFDSSRPFAYRSHTYDCVYLIQVIHFQGRFLLVIIYERYIYINYKSDITCKYIFFSECLFSWLKLQNTTSVASLIHFLEKRNETLAKVSACTTTKTYFNRGFVQGRDRDSRYSRS